MSGLIDPQQRRWFEDTKPGWQGRLLELYVVTEGGDVQASVRWRNGRPNGARRSWYGKLATLEGERLPKSYRRGGERRYRELAGEELERAREAAS